MKSVVLAWVVEVNGEMTINNVVRTRAEARKVRKEYIQASSQKQLVKSATVRRIKLVVTG